MAKTYDVELVGGPCDGRTVQLTGDQLSSGMTSCDGRVYTYAPDTHDPPIFQLAADAEKNVPVGAHLSPRASLAALGGLFRTLAHDVPAQQHRQRAAIARIRNAVR
jgi:hypothetical protein